MRKELEDLLNSQVDEGFRGYFEDWCRYHEFSMAYGDPQQLVNDFNASLRGHIVSARDEYDLGCENFEEEFDTDCVYYE